MRVLTSNIKQESREHMPHESPSSLISTLLILACESSPSSASWGRFLIGASVTMSLWSDGIRGVISGADSTFSVGAVVFGFGFGAGVSATLTGAAAAGGLSSASVVVLIFGTWLLKCVY